jgi:LmbE family N-acetylglucosaminyl deacetylase
VTIRLRDRLGIEADRQVRILALGSHPDDIEIGAAGTIRRLAAELRDVEFVWMVLSGDERRASEARASVATLLRGHDVRVELRDHRDGYLPYEAAPVKDSVRELQAFDPDIVLTHRLDDAHQDHRFVGELSWQAFRRATILEYEIPKLESDRGDANLFVSLEGALAEAKVAHLLEAFPSQSGRPWFTAETFRSTLRLRGIEGRSPTGLAEAFICRKLTF